MSSKMQWGSRVVTDVVGTAGSIVLSDESTAQRDLEDWLHDYYEIDDDEAVTMSRTAVSIGAMSLALGDDRGETGDEALAGSWWKCSDGEADMKDSAEYLCAVAHEN